MLIAANIESNIGGRSCRELALAPTVKNDKADMPEKNNTANVHGEMIMNVAAEMT